MKIQIFKKIFFFKIGIFFKIGEKSQEWAWIPGMLCVTTQQGPIVACKLLLL